MTRQPGAARRPPQDLAGIDPRWSRLVTAPDHTGAERTWHLLDSHAGRPDGSADPSLTLLCVHGNPSWSYLWRDLIASAPVCIRVVAVDQLDMGFSERTGIYRRLEDRVADLLGLTTQLELSGPVVTVAHDWGGPVSLGWGLERLDQLSGVVLTNTAVHQPVGSPAPSLIRAARTKVVLRAVTVQTATFVRAGLALSRPRLDAAVRRGYLAPYESADRRAAIGDFVEDIPLEADHQSFETLNSIATGLGRLGEVPALLLWGPDDPVFSDLYLHDLETRLPHADVHRFIGASHFVPEDADVAGAVLAWIADRATTATPAAVPIDEREPRRSLWAALKPGGPIPAVVEVAGGSGAATNSVSFGALADRVESHARGLAEAGVSPGGRVAVMIPPGIELSVVIYACWRLGAVAVLVDAGLGVGNVRRALASAAPDHLIGVPRALAAARTLRWPGQRIGMGHLGAAERAVLGVEHTISGLEGNGPTDTLPEPGSLPEPGPDDVAAVVFTSGSTGPSKGVIYRHRQIEAQRDVLADHYGITADDRLVAAFAPFALYGPALGVTSAVPDMDVTRPGSLTATALARAVAAIDATIVFASPAALASVIDTTPDLTSRDIEALHGVRLLLSAGAPVSVAILEQASDVVPNADVRTPYGMTEALPIADISLRELRDTGGHSTLSRGVCVGRPLSGVAVAIRPLDSEDGSTAELVETPGVIGEVVVQAAHMREGYDRLWYTELQASQPPGWHRTGDVGELDTSGRLWISGRTQHLIHSEEGLVTPVPIEHAAESLAEVKRAAAVGVGPQGAQVVVVVIETTAGSRGGQSSWLRRSGLVGRLTSVSRGAASLAAVSLDQADRVRSAVHAAVGVPVAAVLSMPTIPVDRRHNSKVDRSGLGRQVARLLAGGRSQVFRR